MLSYIILDILIFLTFEQVLLQDIDDCSNNPCENGGTCYSLQDGYTCECAGDWTGSHCKEKHDAGYSSRRLLSSSDSYFCDNNWIMDRTNCFFIGEDTRSWSSADAMCQVLGGYLAEVNDATTNDVLSQEAKNRGRNLWIGLTDAVIEGTWVWKNSGTIAMVNGINMTYTNWGPGEPNSSGTEDCVEYKYKTLKWNDEYCSDGGGYVCEKAASDIDECTQGNHNCDQNAECTNEEGTFACTCTAGYSGDGTACTDVDECTDGSHNCDDNAECVNEIGTFGCTCNAGFSGDGTNCAEIDECGSNPCKNGATCLNLVNNYNCTCQPGFDGTDCQTDIDECASNPCQNGATCHDNVNKYTCTCTDQFTGTICESDVDECADGSHNCDDNAECVNEIGTFGCMCNAGFSGDGTICSDTDECASSPCQNGATCHDNVNNYTCMCTDKFTGTICETDMCRPQYPTGADVVFLIDVSFSQSVTNFEKEKQFVKNFVSKFPIGQEDFKVSLVTSSIYATVHFYLSNLTVATNITEAIDDLVYEEGPTFTGKGLQKIRESVLHTDNGARDGVSKYVIVLTDGLSSDRQETKSQADLLKSTGVEVISVAVGRQMYHKELIDVASHWTRVFPVSNSDAVNAIFNAHVMEECPECYHSTSDVTLMIDASNEISVVKYYKEIEALNVLLKKMPIGDDGVHISCSQYAQDVEKEFRFTYNMTASDIIVTMNKLEQLASAANMTRALEHLRKFSFLNSSGARNGTRKLAVIVINTNVTGENGQDIIDEAGRLKDSGVTLIIITFTKSENMTSLLGMASDPAFMFVLGDDTNIENDALNSLIGSLDFDVCNID